MVCQAHLLCAEHKRWRSKCTQCKMSRKEGVDGVKKVEFKPRPRVTKKRKEGRVKGVRVKEVDTNDKAGAWERHLREVASFKVN